MKARKSLSIGVVSIIMILMLGTVGVAYGLWAEKLTIDGTVKTGEVDVGFSGPLATEGVEIAGMQGIQPEPTIKDEYTSCTAAKWDLDPDSDGLEGLTIEVAGAYPGYHCMVEFDVDNVGTIPVHVEKPVFVGTIPALVKLGECYENNVQIHPRESTVECMIDITFTNDDPISELSEYKFAAEVLAHQWNEEPNP